MKNVDFFWTIGLDSTLHFQNGRTSYFGGINTVDLTTCRLTLDFGVGPHYFDWCKTSLANNKEFAVTFANNPIRFNFSVNRCLGVIINAESNRCRIVFERKLEPICLFEEDHEKISTNSN